METANHSDANESSVDKRIENYERELKLLSPPKTYRARLLTNVYRHLLQTCLEQEAALQLNMSPKTTGCEPHTDTRD